MKVLSCFALTRHVLRSHLDLLFFCVGAECKGECGLFCKLSCIANGGRECPRGQGTRKTQGKRWRVRGKLIILGLLNSRLVP